MYKIYNTKKARKDYELLKQQRALAKKAFQLVEIIKKNPYQNPPPYEKLKGNMADACSRRINIEHRLVYTVDEKAKEIIVHSLWSHYEF